MREEEKLRARLARLQGSTQSTSVSTQGGYASNIRSLEARLQNLSSSREEDEYNRRLVALVPEDHNRATCAGTGVQVPVTHSNYRAPEDASADLEALDVLLTDALEGEDNGSNESTLNLATPQLEQKLAAIVAAAAKEEKWGEAGAVFISEQAGREADVLEAFLKGDSGRGKRENRKDKRGPRNCSADDRSLRDMSREDEEERLLQMVTDQIRLEGHGVTAQHKPSNKAGEVPRTLIPTTKPMCVRLGEDLCDSNFGQGDYTAASLIVQQAMDEARLGLSEAGTVDDGGGTSTGARQRHQPKKKYMEDSDCD